MYYIYILIILLTVFFIVYYVYNYNKIISIKSDITPENLIIIERPIENIKLIDMIVDKKPYLFDKNVINVLKKKFQVFNKNNFENISDIFYNKSKINNNIQSNNNNNILEHLYTEPIYDKNYKELYDEANKKIKFGLDNKLNNYYYTIDGCPKKII